MYIFYHHSGKVKNPKTSGVSGDDELYGTATNENEDAVGKTFAFLENAICFHEIPRFNSIIDFDKLV